VAYDTMARRSELVAFDLEDVEFMPNGSGTILIRRSKTDAAGEGAQAHLSHETVKWLEQWLDVAGIDQGAIFRRLIGKDRVGERLHADIIADIYKRVARWVGMPARQVDQVSGHSIRVGATQDLLALNIDLASIMHSGRWKSSRMPMRYGEEILAARAASHARQGAKGGIRSDRIFDLGEILEFYFFTNLTLGPAASDTSKDVGSTAGLYAQSLNVVSDAGLPRLAMQARFCDTTAFGRPATEGERAGGKCNDTRAHETGPEEESTSQGRR
jgi:Phage integrase family